MITFTVTKTVTAAIRLLIKFNISNLATLEYANFGGWMTASEKFSSRPFNLLILSCGVGRFAALYLKINLVKTTIYI